MPNINPYQPGDDIFQQYDLTRTQPIKSGVLVTKGELYTKDDSGYIVKLTAASDSIDNFKGFFQAKDTFLAETGESDGDRVAQFLVVGSWMVLKAPADVVEGERVKVAAAGAVVDPDKIAVADTIDFNFIGKVYQILTVDTDENRQLKTADDNLVVVQTGVL